MMTNSLMVRQQGFALTSDEFETMQRMAKAMVASNYFSDVKDIAQAVVKIQAGSEIGIPPFAAISGIHIIKNKPVLGANMIATLVKNSGRYDYRIKRLDDEAAEIAFFENGEEVGESSFTIEDAERAGLLNSNTWKSYPRNMLFSRAISNGARWYAPGIFGGSSLYTPDEMGADEDGNIISVTGPDDVDVDTGEILDGDIVEDEAPASDNGSDAPPDDSDEIKKFHRSAADKIGYFKGPKHVMATMNLLGIKYPETTDEAETALATLAQYATLRADGTEQAQAVKLLQGELALDREDAE